MHSKESMGLFNSRIDIFFVQFIFNKTFFQMIFFAIFLIISLLYDICVNYF
jgi:hypothetical protein